MNPQEPAGHDPDPCDAPPEDVEEIDLERATWDPEYRRRVLRRIRRKQQDGADGQKNSTDQVQ